MSQHEKLNYVELPAKNLSATKAFFTAVFGWEFIDHGDSYAAFSNVGLDGGFYQAEKVNLPKDGGALLLFYSDSLQTTWDKIILNGGKMLQESVFEFPGGYRFHFIEPSGNEFGVWSEKAE